MNGCAVQKVGIFVKDVSTDSGTFVLYREGVRKVEVAKKALVISLLAGIVSSFFVGAVDAAAAARSTRVSVKPPYGQSSKAVAVRVNPLEKKVVASMQRFSNVYAQTIIAAPVFAVSVPETWFVEDAAKNSPMLVLARKSLLATQKTLDSEGGAVDYSVNIVVGRTQKFIADTVKSIGCSQDISTPMYRIVMGGTICGRSIIVMNLTGYLSITKAGQAITDELEQRLEPTIAMTPFKVVNRGASSLAHEWAHVSRAVVADNKVAANEPKWIQEGFAEVMSGIGMVDADGSKMTYQQWHVLRIRNFSNWQTSCAIDFELNRVLPAVVTNCVYDIGAIGVEYLLAQYGGIGKLMAVYVDQIASQDFLVSFEKVYGISVSGFEVAATAYAKSLR